MSDEAVRKEFEAWARQLVADKAFNLTPCTEGEMMSAKQWESEEVKGYDLDDRLNNLQSEGYTIFSVLPGRRGMVTDYVRIVYYSEAR